MLCDVLLLYMWLFTEAYIMEHLPLLHSFSASHQGHPFFGFIIPQGVGKEVVGRIFGTRKLPVMQVYTVCTGWHGDYCYGDASCRWCMYCLSFHPVDRFRCEVPGDHQQHRELQFVPQP